MSDVVVLVLGLGFLAVIAWSVHGLISIRKIQAAEKLAMAERNRDLTKRRMIDEGYESPDAVSPDLLSKLPIPSWAVGLARTMGIDLDKVLQNPELIKFVAGKISEYIDSKKRGGTPPNGGWA